MNKPILCCLKIKSATLLIGVIDLLFHISLLATLFASYSHPNFFDHYYTNSISLVASSSSSCLSSSMLFSDINNSNNNLKNSDYSSPIALPIVEQFPITNSNQNLLNNPLLNDQTRQRHLESFSYSQNLNNSNILLPKDRSIVMLITTFSAFITLMLIYGLIKKRPSYLMPYFSIKVFQVVMASLTTLGFYSCLPNVRLWIQNHNYFPFKRSILLLDNQTLELFVFSLLLASILVKLYTVIIVWYCYRYMITLESFRTLNSTAGFGMNGGISGDESNTGFKIDDESLISQPPKYDDIMKTHKHTSENLPRNNLQATSSLTITNEESIQSDLESSLSSQQVPSYSDAIANKNKILNV